MWSTDSNATTDQPAKEYDQHFDRSRVFNFHFLNIIASSELGDYQILFGRLDESHLQKFKSMIVSELNPRLLGF